MLSYSLSVPLLPPRPPKPRANLYELGDYLIASATFLNQAAFATIHHQEVLMATIEELQAALDRNSAATAATGNAITAELDQLQAAIAALSVNIPPTQEQLDQLNASSDALEAATESLLADDAPAEEPVP